MNIEDIDKLAVLGRVAISQEEKESFLRDLTSIVGYIDQIQSVSIGNVGISEYPHRNVFRDDVVTEIPGSTSGDIVQAMPSTEGRYLKVPRIL